MVKIPNPYTKMFQKSKKHRDTKNPYKEYGKRAKNPYSNQIIKAYRGHVKRKKRDSHSDTRHNKNPYQHNAKSVRTGQKKIYDADRIWQKTHRPNPRNERFDVIPIHPRDSTARYLEKHGMGRINTVGSKIKHPLKKASKEIFGSKKRVRKAIHTFNNPIALTDKSVQRFQDMTTQAGILLPGLSEASALLHNIHRVGTVSEHAFDPSFRIEELGSQHRCGWRGCEEIEKKDDRIFSSGTRKFGNWDNYMQELSGQIETLGIPSGEVSVAAAISHRIRLAAQGFDISQDNAPLKEYKKRTYGEYVDDVEDAKRIVTTKDGMREFALDQAEEHLPPEYAGQFKEFRDEYEGQREYREQVKQHKKEEKRRQRKMKKQQQQEEEEEDDSVELISSGETYRRNPSAGGAQAQRSGERTPAPAPAPPVRTAPAPTPPPSFASSSSSSSSTAPPPSFATRYDLPTLLNASYAETDAERLALLTSIDLLYLPGFSKEKIVIAWDDAYRTLYVLLRGSQDYKDWILTDRKIWGTCSKEAHLELKRIPYIHELLDSIQLTLDCPSTQMIAVGHSLGGYLAQHSGVRGGVITFNKLSVGDEIYQDPPHCPQVDFRTCYDVVSMRRPSPSLTPWIQTIELPGKSFFSCYYNHTSHDPLRASSYFSPTPPALRRVVF